MRRHEFITLLGGAAAWVLREPGAGTRSVFESALCSFGLTSSAIAGGRARRSSGECDCRARQRSCGAGGQGGDYNDSDRLRDSLRSSRAWTCRQPRPTGRQHHGRNVVECTGRTEAAGAGARAGAHSDLLVNPTNPNEAEPTTKNLQAAARSLGLEMHVLHASAEGDFDAAFATIIQLQAGALAIGTDPLFTSRLEQLAALTVRHAVPTVYQFREFTAAGGLMSYGGSLTDTFRAAGVYTGRILKGDKPADLPVQQTTKVELFLNLKTAKALGLTVPIPLLGRADEVIE